MHTTQVAAQIIRLNNPSFESEPASSIIPEGWFDCGKPGETPPDTQPHETFKVNKKAQKGSTYLGMVTRDTDTWEAVAQLLEVPLVGGECYDFSLHLARSASYLSHRKTDEVKIQFTQPIRLRIWGGNNYCDKRELLGETGIVEDTHWKKYDFKFKPIRDYNFIMLEAFYMTPTLVAYNGNILIDNCSPITLGSCKDDEPAIAYKETVDEDRKNMNVPPPRDKTKKKPVKDTSSKEKTSKKEQPEIEEQLIAKSEPQRPTKDIVKHPLSNEKPTETKEEKEEKKDNNSSSAVVDKTTTEDVEKDKKPKVVTIDELDDIELEAGQIIRVNQLNFLANSSIIRESNYDVLEEVYDFLDRKSYISIEIGGHTNNVPDDAYCNKLSQERAESVARYLTEKGIDSKRITAKGYGKTQPIATNETLAGRRKNQRVEIKIISTGK